MFRTLSCCCRQRALPTTNSPISKCAATLSAVSSAICRERIHPGQERDEICPMRFARVDQSPVARWWWTVDRWTLGALLALMAIGAVLSLAASPAVAVRIGYDPLHFVKRHLLAVPISLAIMF